jgi:hypothetical protein
MEACQCERMQDVLEEEEEEEGKLVYVQLGR